MPFVKRNIIAVFCFLIGGVALSQHAVKPHFIKNSNDLFGGNLIQENQSKIKYQSQKKDALFLINKGNDFVFLDSHGFTILSTKQSDSCFVRYDFINPNHDFTIVKQGKSNHYYTSPQSTAKSYGYQQIVYRNIYNNVDLVFDVFKSGLLKYSFIVHDHVSHKNIGFKLSGSFDSLAINSKRFDVIGANYCVIDTGLIATNELGKKVGCGYQKMGKNEIRYYIDPNAKFKQLIIDPFVVKLDTLKNLQYLNSQYKRYGRNVGIEVDFDHHGNVYVYGGDHLTNLENGYCKMAKYSSNGQLQWVFPGYDSIMMWNVDSILLRGLAKDRMYSDILVNKTTEEIYVGHSYLQLPIKVIRLNKDGQHGNFVSDSLMFCGIAVAMEFNHTDTSIWVMGRGYFYYFPSFFPKEMTVIKKDGRTSAYDFSSYQDKYSIVYSLSCGVQDFSGNKYSIFSNYYDQASNNLVYKMSVTPGFSVWMSKARMGALSYNNVLFDSNNYKNADFNWDYRANVLAVNHKYLFTYDGQKFGTLSITDGSYIGITDSISSQTKFYQMGIAVDACNHVFLAGDKGQIHCYSFDGSKFTFDTALQLGSGVVQFIRDVKYDFSTHTILVTGDSILAAVPSPYKDYCDDELLKINLSQPTICKQSLDVKILNADTNSVYSFEWFLADTNVLLQEHSSKSRTNDTLNGLKVGQNYRLRIYRNKIVGHFYRDYFFSAGLPSDTFLQFSRCMGDSFVHNNHAYFSDTLLKDTLVNTLGCDSIVNTQLVFLQNSKYQIYKEICLNDTLVFGGVKIATSGLFRDTISNYLGCDSVIELTVKVNYPKQHFDTVYYCNQPQVNYKGKIRTLPILLKDTFLTFEGCDSVVNTMLFTDTVKALFAIDSVQKPTVGFVNLSLKATTYLWDFGDGVTDTAKNTVHTYSDVNMWSNYQPCLIAKNAKNCSDTFCENFKFYLFKDVKIVEGFSPNSDGVNDTFYIENSRFYPNSELYIMNRYGQIMLHKTQTQNVDLYWDGNYEKPERLLFDKACTEGLYYYFFKFNNAANTVKQGNIYLKR